MTNILGIDPGRSKFGIAVLRMEVLEDKRRRVEYVASTTISTPPSMPYLAREILIMDCLSRFIAAYKPVICAHEAFIKYANSGGHGLAVLRVCGVIHAYCHVNGIVLQEFSAQASKGIVLGNRLATKAEVISYVRKELSIFEQLTEHSADAILQALAFVKSPGFSTEVRAK